MHFSSSIRPIFPKKRLCKQTNKVSRRGGPDKIAPLEKRSIHFDQFHPDFFTPTMDELIFILHHPGAWHKIGEREE
jgi:hypothetical protein